MEETEPTVTTPEGTSDTIKIDTGVKQGDSLSSDLFNIALEATIRALDYKGTIADESVQVISYANDIVIIGTDPKSMNETFLALDK